MDAFKLEEPNWLKNDYAALVDGWRADYSIAISQMEKWAQKELGYIMSSYAGGSGASEQRRRVLEVDELNTLRKLNTIRISKYHIDTARAKISDVDSLLGNIESYRALLNVGMEGLEILGGASDEEKEEILRLQKKAVEQEAKLKESRAALEAFEMELYCQVEKFAPL